MNFRTALFSVLVLMAPIVSALAQAKVMNPGEAIGQLVFLSAEDVRSESAKYKSLSPLSIPVFGELPMDMSVVAGAITLKQQNLLSHVQLKSRARRTPNLDISELPDGLNNPLLRNFHDGDWIHMILTKDGQIKIAPSTEQDALAFNARKKTGPIKLRADVETKHIFQTHEMSWKDFDKVGSKAANYAELAKALNSPERIIVRPGYAIPFYFYQQFMDSNPEIKSAIERLLRDPLMNKVAKVSYRDEKLKRVREMILSKDNIVSNDLVDTLIWIFDQELNNKKIPRKMKLRSSTNSEDLPNFNGAGLYTSAAYKPTAKGVEKNRGEKEEALKETLRIVWSSIWNLRAFEERTFFQIPHADVRMGIQVNPSYENELADGVVVTKNITADPKLAGPGVYIEVQRGSKHSVANPEPGVSPEKILVQYDKSQPLNKNSYKIHILQKSNIADDMETILHDANPKPVLNNDQILDLTFQVLKAEIHFKPLLGSTNPNFSLDLEFKLDAESTGTPQIYIKQARPYID